jgi:hypothetical protein
MRVLGILIEYPESLIAEIGEDDALTLARSQADRDAARRDPTLVLQDVTNQRQNFARTNPDTGEELPPTRCYRFTYRTENQS